MEAAEPQEQQQATEGEAMQVMDAGAPITAPAEVHHAAAGPAPAQPRPAPRPGPFATMFDSPVLLPMLPVSTLSGTRRGGALVAPHNVVCVLMLVPLRRARSKSRPPHRQAL